MSMFSQINDFFKKLKVGFGVFFQSYFSKTEIEEFLSHFARL